ncbi:MAG: tripartite tricarboxylate transporter TctB family protein [Desulfarculaceae bacterium]|nr:tripartite tricarboxylate transporter TctB family protein [Desulfarculaceae bacterium]MCF8046761.1 tripartite tricarboxylate transporter TctB family protein [Desulfarculaceae bacterium]MCF8099883.1 tripartite tricarboxylate transporter TctB family protein [Desulfarculaceae bacterium]MCF8124539.1 tripartite tricarboxylate transporter TctB family protein [Desulfarculaceae bacterium]
MKSHYENLYIGLGTAAIFALVSLWLIPNFIIVPTSVQMTGVSPSFWPESVSWGLVGLGLMLAGSSLMQLRKAKARAALNGEKLDESIAIPKVNIHSVGRFCLTVGAMVGYYYLVEYLGMMLSSMVALFVYTLIYGERRFKFTLPVAVLVPLFLYYFFVKVANIPLPQGPLGW